MPLEALPQPGLPALLGGMREGRLNGVFMGIHAGRAAQHQYSKSRHETKVGTGADPVAAGGPGARPNPTPPCRWTDLNAGARRHKVHFPDPGLAQAA
ncbi:MAG: hypothetical protein ACK54L_10965, partial [Betaproteobacteria bacterium]